MKAQSLVRAVVPAMCFALLASPAFSDSACVSGNLSTIDGTTCDIGNLQFSFTGLVSNNYSYNYATSSYVYNSPWTDSNFTLTVLSNGFELSGPPAQTITAEADGLAYDYADLYYNVTDLNGAITALGVSGGNPSVSGSNVSSAENELQLCSSGCNQNFDAYNEVYDAKAA